MVYLVVAFALSRRAEVAAAVHRGLVLLAGLVPILIFWVEHQVTQRVAREHPASSTADDATDQS